MNSDFATRIRSNFATLKNSSLASAVATECASPDHSNRLAVVTFANGSHRYLLSFRGYADLITSINRLHNGLPKVLQIAEQLEVFDLDRSRVVSDDAHLDGVSLVRLQAREAKNSRQQLLPDPSAVEPRIPAAADPRMTVDSAGGYRFKSPPVVPPICVPPTNDEVPPSRNHRPESLAERTREVEPRTVIPPLPRRDVVDRGVGGDNEQLVPNEATRRDQDAQTAFETPAMVSPTTADGLIGRETFRISSAAATNLAAVRLEALDRFCARTKQASRESLELAIRDGRTGKPVVLTRDLKRLAAESDDVLLDVYIYLASSPAAARAFAKDMPKASDVTEPIPQGPRDPATSRKLDYGETHAVPTNIPAVRSPQPFRADRSASKSPSPQSAHVSVPIRYGDAIGKLRVPVTFHPTLDQLVCDALSVFMPVDAAARLARRAVLTYFRNAIGVLDARHVTMSSDAHVAGLVWEVLERERRGESAADVQLAVHA